MLLSIPLGLSRDKVWREKLFLGLVQIEINLCALLSFCTKPRKIFSRQILSLDKPSGIDNTRKATRKNYDAQKPHSDCHSHLDSMLQPTVPSAAADLEGFTRTYHFFVPSKTTHAPKRRWSWPQRPAATPALQFRNLEPSFFWILCLVPCIAHVAGTFGTPRVSQLQYSASSNRIMI